MLLLHHPDIIISMNISFKPLAVSDFPLLLKWLEAPHVKTWWDCDITYTEALVKEKYTSYAAGYKLENGSPKAINSFIIYIDLDPIGYIQIYNAYNFTRNKSIVNLPKSLAAIDFFIGDINYLGQGLGAKILEDFNYQGYSNILVAPDINNIAAIKTYEKAGFKKIKEYSNEIWMLKCL